MSPIRIGCQFYTWQMSGEPYVGKLPHILKVVEAAGFTGIEPETLTWGIIIKSRRRWQTSWRSMGCSWRDRLRLRLGR